MRGGSLEQKIKAYRPNFKILEKIGTYEKLMRHIANMRHCQKELAGDPENAGFKSRVILLERDVDLYIKEYFEPIMKQKELKKLKSETK